MQTIAWVALGLLLPAAGTALGAAGSLLLRKGNERRQRLALGFAAGVMLAASVWSLLLPAIDAAAVQGLPPWLPATGGFLAGVGALTLWQRAALHRRRRQEPQQRRAALLLGSVTLHNIPEGMAVGVAFAPVIDGSAPLAGALALALGIAVQNVPEGGIVALPLALGGAKRSRAFALGALSGAVEPVFALIALLLAASARVLLPWVLAFAAGCMFFVVAEELLGGAEEDACLGTGAAAVGFALMMALDVALG